MCYAYYRMGTNFDGQPIEAKLLAGISLCQPELLPADALPLMQQYLPFVDEPFFAATVEEKITVLQAHAGFEAEKLFPHTGHLSPMQNKEEFLLARLQQPLVWLRAKKGKREKLVELLTEAKVNSFSHPLLPNAVGLPQQTNIEQVLGNRYYHWGEVQDAASQQTGTFIEMRPSEKVWDCCCGAGGKSLMLRDIEAKIELYSSDVRPQILQNLHERFKVSGLARPFTAVKDISNVSGEGILFENKSEYKTAKGPYFDTIVADVPCTGSGTWARTPEQGYYFTIAQIEAFAVKQRTIVANAAPYLKKGGRLFYITCSVFAAENENQLSYFEGLGLKTVSQQLIEGWQHQADGMFIACLQKQ